MSVRDHIAGQPRTRSWIAVDAQMRNSAGTMGKRGKGRSKRDSSSRQTVRASLRRGDF